MEAGEPRSRTPSPEPDAPHASLPWRVVSRLGRDAWGERVVVGHPCGELRELRWHLHQGRSNAPLIPHWEPELTRLWDLHHLRLARLFPPGGNVQGIPEQLTARAFWSESVAGYSWTELREFFRLNAVQVPLLLGLTLLVEILTALNAAHERGLPLPFLAPHNLRLTGVHPAELCADPSRDPKVKLVDYAVCRLLTVGELRRAVRAVGSARFLAPELQRGRAAPSASAAVFSAGNMVWELLTGNAFTVGQGKALMRRYPDAPPAVIALFPRLCAAEPTARLGPDAALWAARESALELFAAHRDPETFLRQGLLAAVYTGDWQRAERLSSELRAHLAWGSGPDADLVIAETWLQEQRAVTAQKAQQRQRAARQVLLTITPAAFAALLTGLIAVVLLLGG